ncbi:putative two-component system sensor histidine kinase [Sulfitobacter noctilucae]|uniref:sensor histidine kinase n=1 Tax=Sulfitobacter noctilucae TaxID=1342302 RepID=UPI000569F5E7|nr:histidine kinase dimerization/phosphoacceptor domain -containing protein [Sulfitobacter noctilucae]KIN61206.1 putative two-component system sensor histidine kinase [Sulfitobacter noctilucae]
MPIAPLHPKQAERLSALYAYEILETERETEFDEIVQLAAAACGTAISVINFIDAERQWFKAETGLGVRETPLATSLCSHVILEEEFVEIHDTLLDTRMADNPLCCGDEGLRFYAGALLKTADGLPLGTLCVLDHQPKTLTPLQRDTIRVLARQVMAQLELRKTLKHTEMLRKEVDHRVKNSLQSLGSLVRLAGRNAKEEETTEALATIGSRIDAVAMLHQELYRTDAGRIIELGRYVENLMSYFRKIAPENVTLNCELIETKVSSNEAVAVGTLINEFVANAIKHAFPDDRTGQIDVLVTRNADDNRIRVNCRDNGVGLSENATLSTGGLGMQIAAVISAELNAKLDVDTKSNGLNVTFEFESMASKPDASSA